VKGTWGVYRRPRQRGEAAVNLDSEFCGHGQMGQLWIQSGKRCLPGIPLTEEEAWNLIMHLFLYANPYPRDDSTSHICWNKLAESRRMGDLWVGISICFLAFRRKKGLLHCNLRGDEQDSLEKVLDSYQPVTTLGTE